jgi:hypothetical protein
MLLIPEVFKAGGRCTVIRVVAGLQPKSINAINKGGIMVFKQADTEFFLLGWLFELAPFFEMVVGSITLSDLLLCNILKNPVSCRAQLL